MIIRDNSTQNGDTHKHMKGKNKGETVQIDLGRPMTEEEKKIMEQLQEGIHL